ncbi:MAG: FAD binding domain-containing protein [Chloroflexota bacterium]|nr:FAD binding domain-containing protein [Chloroflexota bacterium]
MNLNTIEEIWHSTPHGPLPGAWQAGDSWLAGGTWLFSEPQPHLHRLLDLQGFGWEPITVTAQDLSIASTCTIAQLDAFQVPTDWPAASLIGQCCRSLLASFKVWNTATVGGNVCMSLPAGAMISLATALEGQCHVIRANGDRDRVPVEAFVTGDHQNVLRLGDLLRSIDIPVSALRKQSAFRRMSLTHLGRSSALLIGTLDSTSGAFMLTVTASTVRPIRLPFPDVPQAIDLRTALDEQIADSMYHDDVHGSPDYRKHLTYHFAEEIRQELSQSA